MIDPRVHIPENISQLRDKLSSMLLSVPKFLDQTGYLPFLNLEYVFTQLNEGLKLNRATLGDERYLKLTQLSDQMRALFEADPDDKTGETTQGCKIIHEMQDILAAVGKRK